MTEPKATLRQAFFSRRLAPITLLSLSSGLPLGLVITALPAWLQLAHVDIKTNALLTLVQLPFGFKFVWSPVLDRLTPPIFSKWLDPRRGWVVLFQIALAFAVVGLGLFALSVPVCQPGSEACARMVDPPGATIATVAILGFLISFASASQDIVYDAFAVDVLKPHEHGAMVGARSALYRVGLWVSGNIAISMGPSFGWGSTIMLQGLIFLALIGVTFWAPKPPPLEGKPMSLREAVWMPFVGMLGRPRAVEILAFVLLYRLADSIAGALISPFLLKQGFAAFDVGVLRGAVGVIGTLLGTVLGGVLAARWGTGRALWICGVLQIVSNAGYAVIAEIPVKWGMVHVTSPFNVLGAWIALLVIGAFFAGWSLLSWARARQTVEPRTEMATKSADASAGPIVAVVVIALALLARLGLDEGGVLDWMTKSASFSAPLQSAIFIETLTGGMGWGAFGVLLLRLTDKRFSATQYALFTSLVGLVRTFVGPPAGVMADALGWRDFFLLTMAFGIPGMVMLARFVPWGQEPKEIAGDSFETLAPGAPWARKPLLARAALGATLVSLTMLALSILMATIKVWRDPNAKEKVFDLWQGAVTVFSPPQWTGYVDLVNALIFGLMGGLAVGAYLAARGRKLHTA
ncbi:MAG: MFS transporter [Archangium sp.]|nr:MFS transporter [Archangium sp.]